MSHGVQGYPATLAVSHRRTSKARWAKPSPMGSMRVAALAPSALFKYPLSAVLKSLAPSTQVAVWCCHRTRRASGGECPPTFERRAGPTRDRRAV